MIEPKANETSDLHDEVSFYRLHSKVISIAV